MNPFLALFLYLVPGAFLAVLAHKGFGFGRWFYGALCALSAFGTFLFFAGSVAPIYIVPSISSRIIETVRNVYSALAVFCASAFVGSLLGICLYRKPIFGPKANNA
jgi:hypothetical protein